MALKDSFINLNKALRTTLQNVPAVVDTLIRGFDEIGDAAEDEGTYSTTERVVGKWTDGSTLYERVINVGALPNNTLKTIEIPTGLKIISLTGTAINPTNGVTLTIPYVSLGGATGSVNVSAGDGVISITTDVNREPFSDTNIIIRYIKTTANRAPENGTKNVIDDEPDVKTATDPEELKK